MNKTHTAAWKITGKGKNRAYYATLKAHAAQPGDSVRVVGKSTAVTIGRLIAVQETADGLEHWTFENLNTPADKARNRAINAASQASYWESAAGIATMARREAANLKRATAIVAPVAAPIVAPVAAVVAPVAAIDPAILAALIAAGATPELIAATVVAMLVAPVAAPVAPVAPVKKRKIPAATIAAAMASTPDILAVCDSCNRERKGCATHEGAPELKTCPRCSSLDVDTARLRASRHN